MAVLILVLSVLPGTSIAAGFIDTRGHWAENAVSRWSSYAVINGYPDGLFYPDRPMTRAEFASIIANLLGLTNESENVYSDVNNSDWFAKAILLCTYEGILRGDGANAFPDDEITREQAMLMLARAMKINDENIFEIVFPDIDQVSDWALSSVIAMVNRGYVHGDNKGYLRPKSVITRAEVVTLLDNIITMYLSVQGEHEIPRGFAGIVVIKGNGVSIQNNSDNAKFVIASAYSYVLMNTNSLFGEQQTIPDEGIPKSNSFDAQYDSIVSSDNGIANNSSLTGEETAGIGNKPGEAPEKGQLVEHVNHDNDTQYEYTVTFFSEEGEVYDVQKVQKGTSATPIGCPEKIGYVFDGWKGDLNNIRTNLSVFAMWTKISDVQNFFILPSFYGLQSDSIVLPLRLAGMVDICAFELVVQYDPNKLVFSVAANVDGEALVYCNEQKGEIYINFISNNNINSDLDICELSFYAADYFIGVTDVNVAVDKAARYDEALKPVVVQSQTSNAVIIIRGG